MGEICLSDYTLKESCYFLNVEQYMAISISPINT